MKNKNNLYPWLMVACGVIVLGASYAIVMNCFGIFIKPVTEALGFSRKDFSFALTLIYIFYMLFSITSGAIFKKVDPQLLLRISVIAMPAVYFCYSLCTSLWQFYLCAAILGGLLPFVSYATFTVVIANWFKKNKGLAVGITFMGSGFGGMIFNALAGSWVMTLGAPATYRLISIIMAVVIIPIAFFIVRVRPEDIGMKALGDDGSEGETTVKAVYGPTMKEAFKKVSLWMLLGFALLNGFTTTVLCQTIATQISDVGYSATYAAGVNAAFMGALCATKIILGILYDKLGMKKSTLLAIAATAIGVVTLYLGRIQIMHIPFVIASAFGCASGTVAYPLMTEATLGTREYSTVCGMLNACNSLGGSICPVLTNAVYDATGSYDAALIATFLMVGVSLLLFMLIKPVNIEKE